MTNCSYGIDSVSVMERCMLRVWKGPTVQIKSIGLGLGLLAASLWMKGDDISLPNGSESIQSCGTNKSKMFEDYVSVLLVDL